MCTVNPLLKGQMWQLTKHMLLNLCPHNNYKNEETMDFSSLQAGFNSPNKAIFRITAAFSLAHYYRSVSLNIWSKSAGLHCCNSKHGKHEHSQWNAHLQKAHWRSEDSIQKTSVSINRWISCNCCAIAMVLSWIVLSTLENPIVNSCNSTTGVQLLKICGCSPKSEILQGSICTMVH